MAVLFSGGGGSGGCEEAAKVDNEDEKIVKLVEESSNGCHKFSKISKKNKIFKVSCLFVLGYLSL